MRFESFQLFLKFEITLSELEVKGAGLSQHVCVSYILCVREETIPFRQASVLLAIRFSQDLLQMLLQMAWGIVWNSFPIRHAGPQYIVVWLVIEESVGRAVLVPPLIILQTPDGVAVTVCHNTEVFRDSYSSLCW